MSEKLLIKILQEHLIAVQFSSDSSVDISTCIWTADARVSCPLARGLCKATADPSPAQSCWLYLSPLTSLAFAKTQEGREWQVKKGRASQPRDQRFHFYIYLWSADGRSSVRALLRCGVVGSSTLLGRASSSWSREREREREPAAASSDGGRRDGGAGREDGARGAVQGPHDARRRRDLPRRRRRGRHLRLRHRHLRYVRFRSPLLSFASALRSSASIVHTTTPRAVSA